MNRLRQILKNIIELDPDKILNKILSDKEIQDFIIELNTKIQLFKEGIDSKNMVLGSYAPSTYEAKIKRFGSFPRHYTLLEEGIFYDSFYITLEPQAFIINADPIRDNVNLFDKFGEDIVGLTDESLSALRKKLLPLIIEQVRNAILR